MREVRQRMRAMIAVVVMALLAGCGLSAPKLSPTDPINLIYTTRLAIAQTNDTVAVAVDTGVMSSQDGRDMQTKLGQAAVALLLAETAVDQGRASGDHLGTAVKLLEQVRTSLQRQGVRTSAAPISHWRVNADGVTLTIMPHDTVMSHSGGQQGSVGRGVTPARDVGPATVFAGGAS